MKIHGIIPPVATPMRENEALDLPRLKWFLDHLIAHGVHGIIPPVATPMKANEDLDLPRL